MAFPEEKYDSAFLAILQNEGKIPSFLEELFSFLYRRTDFFIVMKTQKEKMGFQPGVALKLVVDAFKKFETRAKKDAEKRERLQREKEAKAKVTEVVDMEEASPVVSEVEVTTQPTQDKTNSTMEIESNIASANNSQSHDQTNNTQSVTNNVEKEENAEDRTKIMAGNECPTGAMSSGAGTVSEQCTVDPVNERPPAKSGDSVAPPSVQDATGDSGEKKMDGTEDDDDDPELTKQQKAFQLNPESYNGAVRDNYSWAQSITDVDVRIKVPAFIKRGKDVTVTISKKHLKASCKSESSQQMECLLDGELSWDVRPEESMWSLVPGEHIHVNLEKIQERWWEAVLKDEPKISVRKIDPSRPITDLDDEAQAKISEMMYNEQQKRLGKPQSHEMKVHDMLKKAWDAEGSPFRGQPFDPSKVNVSSDGAMGFPPK